MGINYSTDMGELMIVANFIGFLITTGNGAAAEIQPYSLTRLAAKRRKNQYNAMLTGPSNSRIESILRAYSYTNK